MNKTTLSAAKWMAGIVLTLLLLWHLYTQIRAQAATGAAFSWWPDDTAGYFIAACLLLPINIGIESAKWQRLVATSSPITFLPAVRSVLCGIATSLITPNRIGEYPGRIIALRRARSTRLISVSVLGACAQMLALMIAGIGGLLYYNIIHPAPLHLLTLIVTIVFTALLATLYFSFERWAPLIESIRWLRSIRLWGRLLHRFSAGEQGLILGMSLLRFATFTIQYWLLLRWQGIPLSAGGGMLLCALFFWALAVIPSVALAELGVRGAVSIFLFKAYSPNVAGITTATFMLWCINLALPAMVGAVLFFRRQRR